MMFVNCSCYNSRAGQPWTHAEQELLEEYFDKGLDVDDLAWVHQRSKGAIWSRLQRMGRVEYDPVTRSYYRIDRTLLHTIPEWNGCT